MPYKINASAGDECSSTYEGRYITILESLLTHADPGDGLVDKGQPVLCKDVVGVAMNSALANTDYITIDTEGIWYLSVTATTADIVVGEHLFITNAGLIGNVNAATSRNFGFALMGVTPHAPTTAVIAVKVHAEAPVVPA